MAARSLTCRECRAEYPLEARYVCEQCFGPLEVAYEMPTSGDVGGLRRRIQAGPQNIWRYADFLPLAHQPGPSARASSRSGLPAGCTPLIRADRLAERGDLGPEDRVVCVITGDGLKTLDAVRGTFAPYEIDASLDSFEDALAGDAVGAV